MAAHALQRHVVARVMSQQPVGEIEVACLNQLDKPLTFAKCLGRGVTEDRVPFELYEAHRGREPLADERRQFADDGLRVLEFGAGKKRCVSRNVGEEQIALSGRVIVRYGVHCPKVLMEGPVGFEPTTPGLKVRSSTAELRALEPQISYLFVRHAANREAYRRPGALILILVRVMA
jgi:hypothetical protein